MPAFHDHPQVIAAATKAIADNDPWPTPATRVEDYGAEARAALAAAVRAVPVIPVSALQELLYQQGMTYGWDSEAAVWPSRNKTSRLRGHG